MRATPHDSARFAAWCAGQPASPWWTPACASWLPPATSSENRLRQITEAGYLIHDLQCDWRAGAAWFERQLLRLQRLQQRANWLYVAGRGTDPRGGRRFDPVQQAQACNPQGAYQDLWSRPVTTACHTLRLVLGDQLDPATRLPKRTRRWSMC